MERIKVRDDRRALLHPIHGGVCPVGVGVTPPPPPDPPGEPHLIAANSGTAGALRVSGALLRFRSGDGNEYGETGASQPASPGALARSLKKISPDAVHYVDDSNVVRAISQISLGAKPSPSVDASIYYEAGEANARLRIRFIGGTNFYKWHNNF